MASKLKQTQLRRKEQYERKLNNRLALLAERKVEAARINKDPLVKNLRAQIEATDNRLKAIAALEKQAADLATKKVEKAEAEKAAKAAKAAPAKAVEGGKEKKEKKEKGAKAPAEGQEKKEKKEKKKKEEKSE